MLMSENTNTPPEQTTVTFTPEQIHTAIIEASSEAIKPEMIAHLLASQATVNDDGELVLNGKPIKEGVADYLKEHLFLVKPTSNTTGSGAPHNSGFPTHKTQNENLSLTERLNLQRKHGVK